MGGEREGPWCGTHEERAFHKVPALLLTGFEGPRFACTPPSNLDLPFPGLRFDHFLSHELQLCILPIHHLPRGDGNRAHPALLLWLLNFN